MGRLSTVLMALLGLFVAYDSQWAIAAPPAGRVLAGKVVSVSGRALVRKDDSDTRSSIPLHPGDSVYEGDVINTPSNGQVKLLLQDKSIIDIGASSLFKVGKFANKKGDNREVELTMMYGTLRSSVTKKLQSGGKFNVRTPSATMGVRGTEFIVQSDPGDMKNLAAAADGKPLRESKAEGADHGKTGPAPEAKTTITVIQGKVDMAKSIAELNSTRNAGARAPVISLTAGQQSESSLSSAAPSKPVQLNTDQLKSLSAATKVVDNTFTKAIVIDVSNNNNNENESKQNSSRGSGEQGSRGPAGSSGSSTSSSSGGGNLTEAIVSQTIAETPKVNTVSVSDAGFIGTFGATQAFAPSPVNLTPGGLQKVTVNIHR